MSDHSRYAVYFMPSEGALQTFGAGWLGWDAIAGAEVAQTALPATVPPIEQITRAPRKYGFHGTLKPPFHLQGSLPDLKEAVATLAQRTAPARAAGLALTRLGRWFALTPTGDISGIGRIAAACVTELDAFRTPPSVAELDRRRKAGLTDRQDHHLRKWGYPYVLDQFRFHLTLTGKVEKDILDAVEAAITDALPPLPEPFVMADICLCGERPDGRFELIHRYALTG
ncbi:DUF1045 domain-containing protein [Sagittula stellata]|nr:DUF1045 domain-containing protein [Sagittula stellata]